VASIHRRKGRNGSVTWELTHGRPPNRVRFSVGETKDDQRQLELWGDDN
jgi:hypothetical protein